MYYSIKRVFDIIFALLGFILLVPITLLLKIIYLCIGDHGTVFYRQERVGKDGECFMIYKYRSMVSNADEMLGEMLDKDYLKKEWDIKQKFEKDPRITRIGRFLRLSSIDELPQIINVLKGEMSIVGPRPLVEGELESHEGSHIYWKVKPGMTGWWACHGRSEVSYDERLELEYYYIRNQSIKLDAICILKTFSSVLIHRGAI